MCLRWLALFFQHYVLKIISSYVADSFSLPHSPLLYENITIYFYRWPTFAPFPGFAVTTLLLWTFLWCLLVYRCQILRGCPQEGSCRAAGKWNECSALLGNACFPQWWYQFTLPQKWMRASNSHLGNVWPYNFYHVDVKQYLCGLNLHFWFLTRLSISPWVIGPFVYPP